MALLLVRTTMKQHGNLVNLEHDVGEEKFVPILWLLVLATIFHCASRLHSLPPSLMQVDPGPKYVVIPLNLPDSCVEEYVELGHGEVVQVTARRCQEIKMEWDRVRFIQLCRGVLICVQHLYCHNLCKGVLMDARWPFMDEYVVKNLRETRDAVLEGDCCVQSEQGQVKVPPCHILRLDCVRLDRTFVWLDTALTPVRISCGTFALLAQFARLVQIWSPLRQLVVRVILVKL